MGAVVFDNAIFDSWLTKKSDEILSKVNRETITTEEMLTLILKAQTNHFHHMDIEFREEFKLVHEEFKLVREEFREEMKMLRTEFRDELQMMRIDFKSELDQRFEKIWNFKKWQGGILAALFAGLYLKLFLG